MITSTGGNLEIMLWLVHDPFASQRVAWKKFGNQYFFCTLGKKKQLKG